MTVSDTKIGCGWDGNKPHLVRYHDEEWGVPVHDDRKHFEMLLMEGAQAGMAWETILLRREGYRKAFAGFDPSQVASFSPRTKAALKSTERSYISPLILTIEFYLEIQRASR